MKKKSLLLITSFATFAVAAAVISVSSFSDSAFGSGLGSSSVITLDSSSLVSVYADDDLISQANVRNNKFDFVGYSSTGGALGSIKKEQYGSKEYRGMIYNRSVINGFESLEVKFSGGPLEYVFTDFLMEDMSFASGTPLQSEVPVDVLNNKGYFIIYTTDDSVVNIDKVEVKYACDGSIDDEMIYNKNTSLGGARSVSKSFKKEDSFIELENNPTKYTNNYSDPNGNHVSPNHKDPWYRWNGKYFTDSEDLGTEFYFSMTIVGRYSSMVDESQNFHYNVWPQFSYGDSSDEQWVQTYIGNDNYEPLGGAHALHPSDPHAQNSFSGRFFTNYDCYNSNWEIDYTHGSVLFADPDQVKVPDPLNPTMTLRQAYEAFDMPFWHLKFHVYLDEDSDPMVDIFINGIMVYQTYIFEHYDTVNKPSIHIHTLPMHLINYGVDSDGNPAPSYKGWFTYPRLIKL